MDVVDKLVNELRENPKRFHDTDGYERLLEALRQGNAPDALKKALRDRSDIAGDLLWVIAELEAVEPYEWSCALAKRIAPSMEPFCRKDLQDLIEGLVVDQYRARQVVGLTLASFAAEQDESFFSFFSRSDEAWIREYGTWLKGLREPLDLDALDEELKRLGIYEPSKK